MTAAADPDGTIVESSESDNIHEVPCPRAARRDPSSGKRLSRRYDEDGERPLVHSTAARLISARGHADAPIGGQAVLEGVMMRGISTWAVAVRKPSAEQLAAGGAD